MRSPRRQRLVAVAFAAGALVALAAMLRVARSPSYALAGWPGDPRSSVLAMWATWVMASMAAAAAAIAQAPRYVGGVITAAALMVIIEEGDLPVATDGWLTGAAVLCGALLPSLLAWVVVNSALAADAGPPWASRVSRPPGGLAQGPRAGPRDPFVSSAWGLIVVAGCAGIIGALLIDPRLHGCSQCRAHPWRPVDLPAVAHALASTGAGLALAAALLSTTVAAAGLVRRRAVPAAWVAMVALGGWLSLMSLVRNRLFGPLETPTGSARALLVFGLLLAAAGAVWPQVDAARRRAQLVRAVARVASRRGPADIQSALRRAVRDPSLQVAYDLDGGTLVDATGALVSVDGLPATTVQRHGDRVVVLAGARRLDETQADIAVRLAWPVLALELESARLGVAARRLAIARRESVEETDRENRLLGRDLHDNAQQQLVSLMIDIRVVAGRAGGSRQLESAMADVQAALDEVRHLAHGNLPEVLLEDGLRAALGELAGDVPGAVVIVESGDEPMPAAVQSTVYLVVAACLQGSGHPGSHPTVRVWRADDLVRLCVDPADMDENDHMVKAALARVRALGGRWSTQGHRLEVDLPCV